MSVTLVVFIQFKRTNGVCPQCACEPNQLQFDGEVMVMVRCDVLYMFIQQYTLAQIENSTTRCCGAKMTGKHYRKTS